MSKNLKETDLYLTNKGRYKCIGRSIVTETYTNLNDMFKYGVVWVDCWSSGDTKFAKSNYIAKLLLPGEFLK